MQKLTQFLQTKWWITMIIIVSLSFVPYADCLSLILFVLFIFQQNIKLSLVTLLLLVTPQIILPVLHQQPISWLVIATYVFVGFSAGILKREQNWGNVLNLAVMWALIAIFVIYQVVPDIQSQWKNFESWAINALGVQVSAYSGIFGQQGLPISLTKEWLKFLDFYQKNHLDVWLPTISTGLLVISYISSSLLMVLIGRCWFLRNQADANYKELLSVRLSLMATLAFALVLVCPSMDWLPYRNDMLCALFVLYFLAGLSLAHWLTQLLTKPWLGVVVLYIALTFLPFTVGGVIIILAIIDSIINVRTYVGRFPAGKKTQKLSKI